MEIADYDEEVFTFKLSKVIMEKIILGRDENYEEGTVRSAGGCHGLQVTAD